MLPPDTAPSDNEATSALNVMGSWLHRAMTLLVRNDINLNAGYNKVKHGLAVRPRDDVVIAFTTVPPISGRRRSPRVRGQRPGGQPGSGSADVRTICHP